MAHYPLLLFQLCNAWLAVGLSGDPGRLSHVRKDVQPVLERMALKWNMSFSFGFADESGEVGLAAGKDNIWNRSIPVHPNKSGHPAWLPHLADKYMKPDTMIPMGSATKPWTGLRIMQYVEAGRISLEDEAHLYIDPVLTKLWNTSLADLWGKDASSVRIRDLLGMTAGFADYNDETLQTVTLLYPEDDIGPYTYLLSAAKSGKNGWVCKPRTCGTYAGTNFILLGLVLVGFDGSNLWQEFDQRTVIPTRLRDSGRYHNTGFLKYGRCLEYKVAHQWSVPEKKLPNSTVDMSFVDLSTASCLNGWTMGNIATTGEDMAAFFYDVFAMAPTGQGFVNSSTLALMQEFHPLNDTWCEGPGGSGTCQYGLAFLIDQVGQDVWALKDKNQSFEDVRVIGHPGADWGSGCSPCGYNKVFSFGVCVGYNSLVGMNCTLGRDMNHQAIQEATCLIYDAVLGSVGGPRLDCTIPSVPTKQETCEWLPRGVEKVGPHPRPHLMGGRGLVSDAPLVI